MSRKSRKEYAKKKKEIQAQRGKPRRRDHQLFKNRKKMIMDLLSAKNYVPMRAKDMAMLLQIPKNQRYELAEVLEDLVREGKADILPGESTGRPAGKGKSRLPSPGERHFPAAEDPMEERSLRLRRSRVCRR